MSGKSGNFGTGAFSAPSVSTSFLANSPNFSPAFSSTAQTTHFPADSQIDLLKFELTSSKEIPIPEKIRGQFPLCTNSESLVLMTLDGQKVRLLSLWQNQRVLLVFFRHVGCRFCWKLAAMLSTPQFASYLQANDVKLYGILMAKYDQGKYFAEQVKFPGQILLEPLYIEDETTADTIFATLASSNIVVEEYIQMITSGTTEKVVDEKMSAEELYKELQKSPNGDEKSLSVALTDKQKKFLRQDLHSTYSAFRLPRVITEKTLRTALMSKRNIESGKRAVDDGYVDRQQFHNSKQMYNGDVFQLGGIFILGPGNLCDYTYRSSYIGDFPDMDELVNAITGGDEKSPYIYPLTTQWGERLKVQKKVDLNEKKYEKEKRRRQKSIEMREKEKLLLRKGIQNEEAEEKQQELKQRSGKQEKNEERKAESTPHVSAVAQSAAAAAVAPSASLAKASELLAVDSSKEVLQQHHQQLRIKVAFLVSVCLVCSAFYFQWEQAPTMITYIALLAFIANVPLPHFLLETSPASPVATAAAQTRIPLASAASVPSSIPVSSALSSAVSSAFQSDELTTDLSVLTVKDVDEKAVSNGLLSCDCNEVLSLIPMDRLASIDDSGSVSDSDDEPDWDSASRPQFARKSTWTEGGNNEYQSMLCYVRNFLGKHHPMLGRAGPTCPFVPTALKLNTIYFKVIRTGIQTDRITISRIVERFADHFGELEPRDGRKTIYKAVILIFPDVALRDAPILIDGVQKELKEKFVTRGLMVGEFHQGNNSSGLRNSNFYPLRTPYPSLAIRNMVASDIAFLQPQQYSLETRIRFLESYLKLFAKEKESGMSAVDSKEVQTAQEALNKLKIEKEKQQTADGKK